MVSCQYRHVVNAFLLLLTYVVTEELDDIAVMNIKLLHFDAIKVKVVTMNTQVLSTILLYQAVVSFEIRHRI